MIDPDNEEDEDEDIVDMLKASSLKKTSMRFPFFFVMVSVAQAIILLFMLLHNTTFERLSVNPFYGPSGMPNMFFPSTFCCI